MVTRNSLILPRSTLGANVRFADLGVFSAIRLTSDFRLGIVEAETNGIKHRDGVPVFLWLKRSDFGARLIKG